MGVREGQGMALESLAPRTLTMNLPLATENLEWLARVVGGEDGCNSLSIVDEHRENVVGPAPFLPLISALSLAAG
jgi:hypothetical protein